MIDNLANNQKATLTLTGYDAENNELATVTREYTRWVKQDNTIVYMEPEASRLEAVLCLHLGHRRKRRLAGR